MPEFVPAGGQLFLIGALHAPFRQIAAQVPHHLAVRAVVSGDGEHRFVAGADTVSIKPVAQVVFDQHHFQGAKLAVFLLQQVSLMGAVEQGRVAVAGGEQGQLRFNALTIDRDGAQAVFIPFQRVPFAVERQQPVADRGAECLDQRFGVDDQIVQFVDVALESLVGQCGGKVVALELFNAPAQHFAGEKIGHP